MNGHETAQNSLPAWQRLRAGADQDAFAEIFRAHHDAVYNYCFRRLSNWSLAEDATQGTFLSLWRRAGLRRVEALRSGSELAVLLGMARQECLTLARSRHRRGLLVERIQAKTADESDWETDRWVQAETTMAAIRNSLAQLSSDQQDVVELVWWSGLSLAEAADALKIPLGTVKSRLGRARAALVNSDLANLMAGVS